MIKIIKYTFLIGLLVLNTALIMAQDNRIDKLREKLNIISVETTGLTQNVEINVSNASLSGFLQAIANTNNINLHINSELDQLYITNNFSNATVADVLLFACKEYGLDIDFTGNILSIYKNPQTANLPHRVIPISYNAVDDLLSVDLQKDTLYVAFKQISNATNKNLVFAQDLGSLTIFSYIQNMPLDGALDKIAFANNLTVTKTRDNYYLFEKNDTNIPVTVSGENLSQQQAPQRNRRSSFYFQVQDSISRILNVDFENTPISNIIYDLGLALKIDMFTTTPLDMAGVATVKANNIQFDLLLNKILENTDFAYKKDNNIYFFGEKKQMTLRNAVLIPLLHRSIEVMNTNTNSKKYIQNPGSQSAINTNFYNNNITSPQQRNTNLNPETVNPVAISAGSQTEALINIVPLDITKDLEIKVDTELNSFIVSGPSQNVERFKNFIAYIDKPVPVILIELMIVEVNNSATVETGINMGIGDAPTQTQGQVFPNLNMNVGASTINKVIGGFSGFGTFNLGQVVPNFYIQLKAMETNGMIKIRSSPKLSTLNGHRANLSVGETTYYAVTEKNIYGSQNPQTSEITNYFPVEAEFSLNIKPLVSGDGQITLDINVVQSTFNGIKVAEEAPPGMNSREFNSIIRVKDKDLVILGGLEKQIKNDSGTGVPILSRIPVIKWFFSSREREDSKNKLTILIKPTVIN